MPPLDPAAFHFLRPWWLLALIAAVAMAWLAARAQRSRSSWESIIDEPLRDALIERALKKSGPLLPLLTGLVLAIAGIALAGPTWQRLPQPIDQKTDALVIVLDLSLSMYAKDVEPSRLVRARHAVTDILRDAQGRLHRHGRVCRRRAHGGAADGRRSHHRKSVGGARARK